MKKTLSKILVYMVIVAQLAECEIVALEVAGSNPVFHPLNIFVPKHKAIVIVTVTSILLPRERLSVRIRFGALNQKSCPNSSTVRALLETLFETFFAF